MDPKSRADFINSVGQGLNIPCPRCNKLNDNDSKFCVWCGTPITNTVVKEQDNKAGQIEEKSSSVSDIEAVNSIGDKKVSIVTQEEESIFAKGLPSWNIEPPQIPVRRVRRK